MNIKQKIEKIKPYENDIILVVVFVCIALLSFGLGRLSVPNNQKIPVTLGNMASVQMPSSNISTSDVDSSQISDVANGQLVGSKNSDKYHLPWCLGAQRIKEENKVWFQSKEEAEAAGYQSAGNCKGL